MDNSTVIILEFGELKIFDRFTIDKEPDSLFYKDEQRFDGAINAYQVKNRHQNKMLKPVYFSKSYKVNKI